MPFSQTIQRTLSTALETFVNNPVPLVNLLFDLIQRIPLVRALPGLYEVLDYQVELELVDIAGKHAILRKRQRVRFLQNNVIAYQDTAWGDGDIFVDYKCTPGVEVDRHRVGQRYYILISLRDTKHRDEEAEFRIERHIRDGFTTSTEEFQIDIDHRTRSFEMRVIFPADRLPKNIRLIEQNLRRSEELDVNNGDILLENRITYHWKTEKPRLFESYILHWEW